MAKTIENCKDVPEFYQSQMTLLKNQVSALSPEQQKAFLSLMKNETPTETPTKLKKDQPKRDTFSLFGNKKTVFRICFSDSY